MGWDIGAILEDLKVALTAAEAIVFVPLGILAFIGLFALGFGYLNPAWRRKRRQIEQRTDLPPETLDAMFKMVRNPFYTFLNVAFGMCLVLGVTGIIVGLPSLIYGAMTNAKFAIGLGSVGLLGGLFTMVSSMPVLGACHVTLARTVLTEDRIGRLAEFDGDIFETALTPVRDSEVRRYRTRGLMLLVVSLLGTFQLSIGGNDTIASSVRLMIDNWPVGG